MCSEMDDPTQYDGPVVSRPRKYDLSGSEPPKPSIALAVIGTMIDEYEVAMARSPWAPTTQARWNMALLVLRSARQRIAKAEAEA